MSIVSEVYLTARGATPELSLKDAIQRRKEAEEEIFAEVNKLGKLEPIDVIAMMAPIATAPLRETEYFGSIFNGQAGLTHADLLTKMDLPELADIQRIFNAVFGVNEDQKFLFSLKADQSSPAGFSVNKLMLLIDSSKIIANGKEELDRMLATLGIPEGFSVSLLFQDSLAYQPDQMRFQQMLTSNLLGTYLLTTLAAENPKVFNGSIGYKLTSGMSRSTYEPGEGEVLFELTQTAQTPMSWFEIFDKVDNDDFDLNTELANHINANLARLSTAV